MIPIAEVLLGVAKRIKHPQGELYTECRPGVVAAHLELGPLSLNLAQLPPVVRFRAMAEEWDLARIVREIY